MQEGCLSEPCTADEEVMGGSIFSFSSSFQNRHEEETIEYSNTALTLDLSLVHLIRVSA